MRNPVTQTADRMPREIWMILNKIRVRFHQTNCGLTDHDKAHADSMLCLYI